MLGELEQLGDRQLDALLCVLERRIRSAIALGEPDVVGHLLNEYLDAHDESGRRFHAWLEARARSRSGGRADLQLCAKAS